MKLRCWPGCLAVVTWVDKTPELKGRVVEVVRHYVEGERISGSAVNHSAGATWVVRGNRLPWRMNSQRLIIVDERALLDRCLTPITPPPSIESIDQAKELTT